MNIKWHYWCGTKNHENKYVKYLLISINSLINIGKVYPKDIYITIENKLLDSKYGQTIKNFGINIIPAPQYPNYSKQICYYKILQLNSDIDKLIQIDCDTIITDSNILEKICDLSGCLNIDTIPSLNVYETIQRRDGQKQKNNTIFSVGFENTNPPHSNNKIEKYYSFKDYLQIQYNINFDNWIEKSKNEELPTGFCYVLSPKKLPKDFFKFLASLNFFFEDDEMSLVFAKFYFNIEYNKLNIDQINKHSEKNIRFQAKLINDFNKYKGIIHFPPQDGEIEEETTKIANKIANII